MPHPLLDPESPLGAAERAAKRRQADDRRGDVRFLCHNLAHAVAGLLWFCGLPRAGDWVHLVFAVP